MVATPRVVGTERSVVSDYPAVGTSGGGAAGGCVCVCAFVCDWRGSSGEAGLGVRKDSFSCVSLAQQSPGCCTVLRSRISEKWAEKLACPSAGILKRGSLGSLVGKVGPSDLKRCS